jgi:hypothetical protein
MNVNQPRLFAMKAKKRGAPRSKVTYDLIPELHQRINTIAQQLSCSQSDVAIHLLAKGLSAFDSGQMNLRAIRVPHSFQLRFAYKLPLPRIPKPSLDCTQRRVLLESELEEERQ